MVFCPRVVAGFEFWVFCQHRPIPVLRSAHHCGRISGYDGKIGKVAANIAVGCDDTPFSDGGVGHDCRVGADEGISPDADRPADQPQHLLGFTAMATAEANGVVGGVGGDGDKTGDLASFPDADLMACLEVVVMAYVHIVSKIEALRVIDERGTGDPRALKHPTVPADKRPDHPWRITAVPEIFEPYDGSA